MILMHLRTTTFSAFFLQNVRSSFKQNSPCILCRCLSLKSEAERSLLSSFLQKTPWNRPDCPARRPNYIYTRLDLDLHSRNICGCHDSVLAFHRRLRQNVHFLCTKAGSRSNNLPVLTLFTKDPCPLCEEALEVLSPYLHQVVLEKVDITKPENRLWWKEYKYDIPVFHLDGKFLMKHRANVDVFLDALEKK